MRSESQEDHLVVLLHGLGRTRRSMAPLAKALSRGNRRGIALGYPSRSNRIAAHTAHLKERLKSLPPAKRISFVTHSLGGIVTRGLFEDESFCKDIGVHRVVMLAPPNQGAMLASRLDRLPLRIALGPVFGEIAANVPQDFPVPNVPFAIIAGDAGRLSNPLIDGRNDAVVSVDETKLEGAAKHQVVSSLHTLIMNHPDAVAAVDAFLSS